MTAAPVPVTSVPDGRPHPAADAAPDAEAAHDVGPGPDVSGDPAPGADALTRVWCAMRTLVLERHDHRGALRRATGLSPVRVKLLRRLAAGPLSLRELAEAVSTDAPYTTVLVSDLVARGLAERRAHPVDGRAKIVVLTAAGHDLVRTAEVVLDTPPDTLRLLSEADVAVLDRVLGDLLG